MELSGPAHEIVTKTVLKTLPGGRVRGVGGGGGQGWRGPGMVRARGWWGSGVWGVGVRW